MITSNSKNDLPKFRDELANQVSEYHGVVSLDIEMRYPKIARGP